MKKQLPNENQINQHVEVTPIIPVSQMIGKRHESIEHELIKNETPNSSKKEGVYEKNSIS